MSEKTISADQSNETASRPLVNYRVDSGVGVLELNDPPANTYSYAMNRQLDQAILLARMDENVHVIALTGAGDKFFCAGANIQMLAKMDPTFKYYFCLHANETLLRLEHTPKLVIAALNGHCVGGGLEVAMAADLRVARKDAGKIGLVNEIFEHENFMERVMEYARQFCPPKRAAMAVGRIKRAVQTGWEISLEAGLALERENQQLLFESDDAKEGLTAYLEKRPPVFTGE